MPIDNPAVADGATKEFFVPAGCGTVEANLVSLGYFQAVRDDAYYAFKVPHDFSSIVSAEAICVNTAPEELTNIDFYSDYGAEGEHYDANSESSLNNTYDFPLDHLVAFDISGILNDIAADDYVGIRTDANDATVRWLGIRFRYS